jgi:hypothetical protein
VAASVPEAEQGFDLSPDELSRLQEAIAQADRGEGVDGWLLLEELKADVGVAGQEDFGPA